MQTRRMRCPKFIEFFLVVPVSFSSIALKTEKLGDYNVEISKSSSDSSNAVVYDKKGKLILTLDHLYSSHVHHFELQGEEIFWIKRTGDPQTDKDWEDQLWVTNIKSKKDEKLISQRGVDFRPSPDGKKIAFTAAENDLKLLERPSSQIKTIAKVGEGERDDGFTLLNWSKDGKKFWFGSGVVEGWSKLGLFEADHVKWLPYSGGTIDEAFDPNRGWLVISDAPFNFDAESENAYKKNKKITHLTVTDVLTGKKAELAKAQTNRFNPKWISNDVLEYTIDDKKREISATDIQAKLKSP